MVRGLKFQFVEVLAGGVIPEVDAPEGSGVVGFVIVGWPCFGRVPDVEGVRDECGELEEDEPLELASGGVYGAGCGACGATGAGGACAAARVVGALIVGPNGCPVLLEFWYCIWFSSKESVDVFSLKSCPQILLRRC